MILLKGRLGRNMTPEESIYLCLDVLDVTYQLDLTRVHVYRTETIGELNIHVFGNHGNQEYKPTFLDMAEATVAKLADRYKVPTLRSSELVDLGLKK